MKYELVKLNTARNCLKYVIRAFNIKELYLPYYLCPAIRIAAAKEKCRIIYYHINTNFEPQEKFPSQAFILYPNYFGICTDIVNNLAKKYPNLIVDNAHSFFSEPKGIASFNSLRKFFPKLRDGAFLYTKQTLNEDFKKSSFEYDLKELDYKEICINENRLDLEDILLISDCTMNYFNSLDMKSEKEGLIKHFNDFQDKYGFIKELKEEVPFKYPMLANNKKDADKFVEKLTKQGFTIYRYWNNMPEDFTEYPLYERLVAI